MDFLREHGRVWVASVPQAEHCWTCWCDCLSQLSSLFDQEIPQRLFLKDRAVPDLGRWKPDWAMVWEGAIRAWAPVPTSPDNKPHLVSFATASLFQRLTNSTSPLETFSLLRSCSKVSFLMFCWRNRWKSLVPGGYWQGPASCSHWPPSKKLWSESRRNQTSWR